MYNLVSTSSPFPSNVMVLVAPATDPLMWNLFLFFLFLGSILAAVVLYLSSKTPEDWRHDSALDKPPLPGRLTSVSHQFRQHIDNGYNEQATKRTLQTLFLDKVRIAYGLTSSDVLFFHEKDPNHLQNLIHDNVLYSWLFLNQPVPLADLGGENQKLKKKQRRFMELQTMIKRMEEWEA
jgi:hypothetical protein